MGCFTVPRLWLFLGRQIIDGEPDIDAVLESRLRLGFQEPVVPLFPRGRCFVGGCNIIGFLGLLCAVCLSRRCRLFGGGRLLIVRLAFR